MKPFYKIAAIAFAGVSILAMSCKKNAADSPSKTAIDYTALAKQIALGLGKTSTNATASTSVKTGATGTLKVFDITSVCGTSDEKNTNQDTKLGGDTTENVKHHTIFTYLCEDSANPQTPNAYHQRDTLVDAYSGSLFKSSYTIALDWHVNALGSQERLSVNGDSKTIAFASAIKDGVTTYSTTATFNYHWTNVLAIQDYTFQVAPYFDGGKVDYTYQIVSKTTGSDDQVTNLSGTINFVPGTGDIIVTFNPRDNQPLLTYLIEFKTGKVIKQM